MKKLIITVSTVLLLAAASAALYYFVLRPPTASELYRTSITKAISIDAKTQPYLSFDIRAGDQTYKGQAKGDIAGDNSMVSLDFDVKTTSDDVSMQLRAQAITIATKGKPDEGYVRYTSISSPDESYAQYIDDYFRASNDKWVKMSDTNNEDKPTSFEDDGPIAVFDFVGVFTPIFSLNAGDREIFLKAIEKYHLYTLSETIEQSQFRGIQVRKLQVSIRKDDFMEFEKEVSQSLSKEADFTRLDDDFVDQAFGADNQLRADVYIDAKKPVIVGVDMNVKLLKPVTENTFQTTIGTISTSVLIDNSRNFTVEAPKDYISQDQYNALLGT